MSKYTEAEGLIKKLYYEEDYCIVPELATALETAIEALEIADRLKYAYHNAFGIDLAKCTKYGNKSAEQQSDSYSTVMMYEVANVFDNILGE